MQQYIHHLEGQVQEEMSRHAPLYGAGLDALSMKELETLTQIHEEGLRMIHAIQQQQQQQQRSKGVSSLSHTHHHGLMYPPVPVPNLTPPTPTPPPIAVGLPSPHPNGVGVHGKAGTGGGPWLSQ